MSAFGNLSSKFDQLSRRERVMVAGVCWVLIAVLLYLPMESLWLQYQRQQQQLHSVVNLRQGNSEQIALLQQRLAQDPNQALHQQIDTLQQQIVALDQRLNSETVDLIPAARMPALLTKLLQQSQGVKLQEFHSIAPTPLLVVGDEGKEQMNLYSHGISLTFVGDYFSVLKFVRTVEEMPEKLYWQSLDYQVQQFPEASVKLALYTVSINKDFISVATH
ncbi:type 4a pilus biogenesis protein PilO [Shewanella dokdonensis]|uniref:type 4a pilus biogenesis protein PilO n=2 Tax=Shewanella dokdonensis TaxID=712036 RepID=UPI00200FDF1E|nr:type 4a pilus biogenesis protein PilO [Shewanella dokdonensis]MCL1075312.1 type 4a pilus biogenesis protein PilO [Shewanella dokdonensis]